MVKQVVADYARWKLNLNVDGTNPQTGGSKGGHVFRSAGAPNEVVLLLEWELEQAREFSQREAVSAKLKAAAGLGPPECSFLDATLPNFRPLL
jgi:hypothetical protein